MIGPQKGTAGGREVGSVNVRQGGNRRNRK